MIEIKKYLIKNSNKAKIHSKDIIGGDIFISLPGKNTHGNKYILDAFENGAKYIVTDVYPDKKIISKKILVVNNILNFLEEIAKKKRSLFNGKVIGITGSIGKTSVKENLKFFLSNEYKVSASIKSYNNYLGVIISLVNLNLDSYYAIFEIGTNNNSEIKILTSIILPSQIIITNIYPTHLEKLINTRNIAKEKSDIFNVFYNPNIELAIISNNNIDEKFIIKKAKKLKITKIVTFGKKQDSDLIINDIKKIDNNFYEISFSYIRKNYNIVINQNQYYRFNNILICFLILEHNKINLNFFKSQSKNIPLLDGRGLKSEIIIDKKKINLIDESYNASPESVKICINFFQDLLLKPNQKKIIILGDMKELGENALKYHIDILNYIIDKKIQNVIICGELFYLALEKIENTKILFMLDLKSILEYLKKIINMDDIVLIKGSNSSLTNFLTKHLLKNGDI